MNSPGKTPNGGKPLYAILFDSSKVRPERVQATRSRLQAVFKASEAQVTKLFAGKPVALKKNLGRVDAIRYRSMLQKAGVAVEIYPPLEKKQTTSEKKQATSAKTANEQQAMSLAPVGSDLLDKKDRVQAEEAQPDISGLSLSKQGGNLVADEEREVEATVPVDDHTHDWQLSQEGQKLLLQEELAVEDAVAPDTSMLDLDGTDPGYFKELKEETSLVQIDISRLGFADEEGE